MIFRARIRLLAAVLLLGSASSHAGPNISAGDFLLRHDIQQLADVGIIKGPTTTWPLAWGPILHDLSDVEVLNLPPNIADAHSRLRNRAMWETRSHQLKFNAKVGIAENETRIRSFKNSPRGDAEIGVGLDWIDTIFSLELNVQGVESGQDSDEIRGDDSHIGVVLGNWSVAASTQQRWWGPGWDGSLILSNNARPIPSLTIDRIFTDRIQSKWLSWIGPWDLSVIFGQLERDRHVPRTRFFGMRATMRPSPSLEFGLFRTAQWCGDNRPCDLGTFGDLLIGRDNRGGDGIDFSNEPGNQLAGLDFRWSPNFKRQNISVYGQFLGEDEAGGLPSRWLGLLGAEWSGYFGRTWSSRVFAEFAGTSCQFYESSELFDCAYNHGVHQTGYRFRGRSVGHGIENDARVVSAGLFIVNEAEEQWQILLRYGALNRGGQPDIRNTLTPTKRDLASIDLSHSRVFLRGVAELGVGFESVDDLANSRLSTNTRFYLQWRSSY